MSGTNKLVQSLAVDASEEVLTENLLNANEVAKKKGKKKK